MMFGGLSQWLAAMAGHIQYQMQARPGDQECGRNALSTVYPIRRDAGSWAEDRAGNVGKFDFLEEFH